MNLNYLLLLQAEKLYKDDQLEQLEAIQKVHGKIWKRFSSFSEIFQSGKNNIVGILVAATTQQVNTFIVIFGNITYLLLSSRKSFATNLHVHAQMLTMWCQCCFN